MDGSTLERRWRRFDLAILVVVFAIPGLYWLVARAPLPFDSSAWYAGLDDWLDPMHRRHRIADWLLLTGQLVGETRADLVARLGEPPETGYFKEWDLVYLLGAERGFISIDSEWLVIRFDDAGIARDARIVTD